MTMTTDTAPIAAVQTWRPHEDLGRRSSVRRRLLFVAGATILMGIITAEALYPGTFTTGANEISDLGGTRPPNSVILQPSATMFDVSMALIGVLVLAGSWFVQRAFGRRSVSIPIATLGVGAFGVGLFPGNTGNPHAMFAMVTFISGGIAALSATRVTSVPFRYFSLLLGRLRWRRSARTCFSVTPVRWRSWESVASNGSIVYPVVLWITGFGGYLSGRADGRDDKTTVSGEVWLAPTASVGALMAFPPSDSEREAFWRDYLTNGDAMERRVRRVFRALPHAPRCQLCAAPFAGPAAP